MKTQSIIYEGPMTILIFTLEKQIPWHIGSFDMTSEIWDKLNLKPKQRLLAHEKAYLEIYPECLDHYTQLVHEYHNLPETEKQQIREKLSTI